MQDNEKKETTEAEDAVIADPAKGKVSFSSNGKATEIPRTPSRKRGATKDSDTSEDGEDTPRIKKKKRSPPGSETSDTTRETLPKKAGASREPPPPPPRPKKGVTPSEVDQVDNCKVAKIVGAILQILDREHLSRKERKLVFSMILSTTGQMACTSLPAQMATMSLSERPSRISPMDTVPKKNPKKKKSAKTPVAPTKSPYSDDVRERVGKLRAKILAINSSDRPQDEKKTEIRSLRARIKTLKGA